MSEDKILEKSLYLLSECLNWNLFQRSLILNQKPCSNDLLSHEIQALKFISKHKPKKMCLWLADYMREKGYVK